MGDFNLDYANATVLPRHKIENFQTTHGLDQLISDYTLVTPRSGSIIDHIYTNCNPINKSGTLNINISDHYPVFAIRKKQRHHIPKKIITCRIYRNYHKDLFVDNLINQDWSIFDRTNAPDILWKVTVSNIHRALDPICPIKSTTVPEYKPKWINNDVIALMRDRDSFYHKARPLEHSEISEKPGRDGHQNTQIGTHKARIK